jgi:hypothetical protein
MGNGSLQMKNGKWGRQAVTFDAAQGAGSGWCRGRQESGRMMSAVAVKPTRRAARRAGPAVVCEEEEEA